jgi:hypothetical protein
MILKVPDRLIEPHTEDNSQVWILARDLGNGLVEIPGAEEKKR